VASGHPTGGGNVGLFREISWEWNRELFFMIKEFQKSNQGIFRAV
jgi:hypothetical protein